MTVLRSNLERAGFAVSLVLLTIAVAATPRAEAKDWTELIIVVNDEDGDPVSRASIVLSRLKGKKLRKTKGRPMQIKTSLEGTAPLPPLERGHYMLQVISQGFQTHGDKIELVESEQTHVVTMLPPQNQFSVHTGEKK